MVHKNKATLLLRGTVSYLTLCGKRLKRYSSVEETIRLVNCPKCEKIYKRNLAEWLQEQKP